MPAEYTFLVEDIPSGVVIGALPLIGAVYEDYLRRPGAMRAQLTKAAADQYAELLEEGRRAVYVRRNDTIEWGGILMRCSLPTGGDQLSLGVVGWLAYWDHRDIWTDRQFAATDQFSIFETLVNDAQNPAAVIDTDGTLAGAGADVGITVDYDTLSGVLRDRLQEYRYFAGKNLGTALRELAGLEDGFDYAMEYVADAAGERIDKTLRLSYPQRGVDHGGAPGFEFAGFDVETGRRTNVLGRGLTRDASRMAWRVRGWGAGADVARLRSDDVDDTLRGVYPFLDGQANYSSVTVQGTLDEHTVAERQARGGVSSVTSLLVNPEADPSWGSYGIGDTWQVRVDDGWGSFEGPRRIVGYSMDCTLDRPTLMFQDTVAP